MAMFDDPFGMATRCMADFRVGVRDSFGAAMIADVLEPILKEIDALRDFNEEFQRQALTLDCFLEEARTIQFKRLGSSDE